MPDNFNTTNLNHPDNVKALLDAGAAHARSAVTEHGGKPFVIVPKDYKIETLERPPERIGQTRNFSDVDSFALYVTRFSTPGTLLFARVTDTDCSITAHLDYHNDPVLPGSVAERRWSSHTAQLACVLSREWATWMKHNGPKGNGGEAFSQTAFAQFLEDNERVFEAPDAASLLELVTTLEGKNNVRFNSAVKLSNGRAKLDFEEDVELRGGVASGQIEVPTELVCRIIPFENGPVPYRVRSRLRYRIANRQIVFWYETVTPHLILRDAAKSVMDAVREKVKAPLLIGG